MAQNITIAGNQYPSVPAIEIPKTGGGGNATFTDTSPTTASASDVAQGKIFFDSTGTQQTGTASGGGGSSAWTKVAETSYQVTATNTSAATVATWETGHSELWNTDKMVYVRIRDTDGSKNGYFFGTDNLFWNSNATAGVTSSTISGRVIIQQPSGGGSLNFLTYSGTTGYGIYADTLYSNGDIRIRKRYGNGYSGTIDGTYKIEVYMIDYPTVL